MICIPEGEEVVLQQIHLQDRLFCGQGLEVELLYADHIKGLFFLNLGGGVLEVFGYEGAFSQAALQAGLVFTDLTLNGVHALVKGAIEGNVLLLASENGAVAQDGDLKRPSLL